MVDPFGLEVSLESLVNVFAAIVAAQYFDALSGFIFHQGFELFEFTEDLIFRFQEVDEGLPRHIVDEGQEIFRAARSRCSSLGRTTSVCTMPKISVARLLLFRCSRMAGDVVSRRRNPCREASVDRSLQSIPVTRLSVV